MGEILYGNVSIGHYVMLSTMIFVIGVCGMFMNRRNIITLLMAIELMLLAVNINFVAFSVLHGDVAGQIFSLLVLTVAAAEAAIGLAILVIYFRNRGTIDIADAQALKG